MKRLGLPPEKGCTVFANQKTLTFPGPSGSGVRHVGDIPAGAGPFRAFVPDQPSLHPSYYPLAVVALLLPPLGLLAYLLLACSRNTLDRSLSRAVFWRTLTLPMTCMAVYYLVFFLLRLAPYGRLWTW